MNDAETRAEHIDPALKTADWGVVEVIVTLGLLAGASMCAGQNPQAADQPSSPVPTARDYWHKQLPAADLLKAQPQAIEAWKDMRFGMFICWGPVTLTGRENRMDARQSDAGRGIRQSLQEMESRPVRDAGWPLVGRQHAQGQRHLSAHSAIHY